MPRSKGGELLEACEGCYNRKLSCRMGGRGGRTKRIMEKTGAKKPRHSSESKEERNASGKEWLRNFSTMKVGPPRHAKPAAELRQTSLGAKVTGCRMTSRPAGLEAKKRLHKLCKSNITLNISQLKKKKSLLILQINTMRPGRPPAASGRWTQRHVRAL